MIGARLAFAAWLAAIILAMLFGQRLRPFIEGPARAMLGWVLGMIWAWFLAMGARFWFGLPQPRRRRSGAWLLAVFVGLFLLAWVQPLISERLHVVLYGGLGLLAYRMFRDRPAGRARWQPALIWTSAVAVSDEIAQAIHPERVGDPRDALTNAAAAALLIAACVLLDPDESPSRPD